MALAFLRRHQRYFHVLLGVVILGFIVFGPTTMFTDTGMAGTGAEEVGRVGELPITAQEFQSAYVRLRNRYERMSQNRLDPRMIRMLGLDRQVFDSLVEQRVVELESRRLGLEVSDRELAQAVATMPFFQENGRFVGAERVRQYVESQGMTLADFERGMRQDLLRRQLEALVTDGVTVSAREVEEEYRKRNEEIKAEYVLVDSGKFTSQVSVGDEDVRAHFDSDKESYRLPETRVVRYVHVDPTAVRAQVAVTDADITNHYRARKDQFREEEQVCARHVLVKVKGESETEGRSDEAARKLAQDLLAQIRSGADFAAIAKKSSDDTGSAMQGGDLGCFGRGTMVNEFENVAFSLKKDEISEPVKTQYGYHVIQAKETRPAREKPLDEVKESIRAELLTERSQAKAEQLSTSVAGALAAGRSLGDAATASGLQTQTSQPLARGEAHPLFNGEVLARVFELKPSETVREPFAVANGFVFVSFAEAKPSRVPELTEVQERVKADVIQKKTQELARARAAEVRAKAVAGALDKAASALGLTRKETTTPVKRGNPFGDVPTSAALEEAAFSIPAGELSEPIPVANGYVVIRVTDKKAVDPAAFDKERGTVASSLRTSKRTQFFDAYLAQARQRVTVERNAEALRRFTG